MDHVHDCPTEGCNGYWECGADCGEEQASPCYECLRKERDEARKDAAKEKEEALLWAQVSFERTRERDEARAEAARLKGHLHYIAQGQCDNPVFYALNHLEGKP